MTPEAPKVPTAHGGDSSPPVVKTGTATLLTPSDASRDAGAVLSFTWRDQPEEVEVRGDVLRGASGLVISRVEVTALSAKGVTHQLLRKAPLGELLASARAHLAQGEPASTETAQSARPEKGARHTPMTDDLLREVALAYLAETGPGKDRAAIKRLEDRFDRPRGTILTWVNRARKEGWLGPAIRGRMGSEPGPKLKAWTAETMTFPIRAGGPSSERLFAAALDKLGGARPDGQVAVRLVTAMTNGRNRAEQQASQDLGIPGEYVDVLAMMAWERPLSEELDRRISDGEDRNDAVEVLTAELAEVLRSISPQAPDAE